MTTLLRALIIEDSVDDAELLELALRQGGYEIASVRVETSDEFLTALDYEWDIVFSDYSLPQFGAEAAFDLLRRSGIDLPFIVISGTIGEEVAVAAMQNGVNDFLVKDNLARLIPAVQRELREAENRRARGKAETSASQLAAIVQSSTEAIVSESLDGRIKSWNPAAERMFGWSASEVIGQSHSILVPADCEDELNDVIARLRRGERVEPFETIRICKNGLRIPISIALSPINDRLGQLIGISKIARDITEQKRVESALRLQGRAMEAVTQGILITDANENDYPIIYASPGFQNMTGYIKDEILGKNCRFLQGQDTDRETVAQMRQAIEEVRPATFELVNYKKDGTPFWNELSLSPVFDQQEQLTHFVGVTTDVTERRRLEENYRQVQKMEAFGQLAGGVAHDFNNLLTVINGYCDLLLESVDHDDPSWELLEQIRKAGERSASLTKQLLAFSRKQVLSPRVLDLNGVVLDTQRMLHRLIGEDIVLSTSLAEDLGAIRADASQIEQVLLNLVVNARDAMAKGGRLNIETRNVNVGVRAGSGMMELRPGPYVMIKVADTGAGMPEHVKSRVFEPFFTTKGQGQGTGLGLAVVHGVVKQSDGYIDVVSEPGKGTSFQIYFPRIDQPVSSGTWPQPSESITAPSGSEVILLVEDDELVRVLSRRVLDECGYKVLEAAEGEKALELGVKQAVIDLLITDVVMPGLGGRALSERLLLLHPGMDVLFISGYTDDEVVRHGVLHEKVNFLQKPFSPASLAQKVRDILNAALRR